MTDSFSGGCACGAIRYRSTGPARYMGNCHCRHCQQATGALISRRFWSNNPTLRLKRASQAGSTAPLIADMPCAEGSVQHAARPCF